LKLTADPPSALARDSYGPGFISVNETRYRGHLLIAPNRGADWNVAGFDALRAEDFAACCRWARGGVLARRPPALPHPRLLAALTAVRIVSRPWIRGSLPHVQHLDERGSPRHRRLLQEPRLMTVTDDKKVAEFTARHECTLRLSALHGKCRALFYPKTTRRVARPRRRLRAALPAFRKPTRRCWCLARQFEVTREFRAKMDFRSL